MALTSTVRARVDSNLKAEVEEIFKTLGISTSQAINMFLSRVKTEKGIPFELKIPNKTTLKAMEEAENMEGDILSFEDLVKNVKTI